MNIFLDANICLNLLDSTRATSKASIDWYISKKDDPSLGFYFSSDFITTFYYILTERNKLDAQKVVEAIEALSFEIEPFYLSHSDFVSAKNSFLEQTIDDFEDLMIINSAIRCGATEFITNDKKLLKLGHFGGMKIIIPQ